MTKTTFRFSLRPVRGSMFDLWRPVEGGPSIVRPASVEGPYWPGYRSDSSNIQEFAAMLWKEFRLPNDFGFTEIDSDSPRLPAIVARLAKLKHDKLVCPVNGWIEIALLDSPEDPCQWFELNPQKETHHIDHRIAEASCFPDKAKAGVHVTYNCVDEKFKALVEKNGFTGLEFLWLKDIGRYAAPQWFLATARNPIGRGIDHEFFDHSKYQDNPHPKRQGLPSRIGVTQFKAELLLTPAPFSNDIHNQFVSLFAPNELTIDAHRQFLQEFLPNTDFAYAWNGCAFLSICFNRRVRDALLANSIISADDCEPIRILRECPPGAQMLDGVSDIFPHSRWYFSDEEYPRIRQELEKAWELHVTNPKPKRVATMRMALSLLQAVKRACPESFESKLKQRELESADSGEGVRCPKQWIEVLKLANGFSFSLDDTFEALPFGSIEGYSHSTQSGASAGDLKFPSDLLHITHGLTGDFHSLDLSSLTAEGNCRVLQFSHETLQPEREWSSIAEFVQEIAESMLNEPAED